MKLLDIFKKQGGLNLFKRYLKSGALFTACAEFLLLGHKTKALEILRLAADYKTKKNLEKKYIKKLKLFEANYDKNIAKTKSNKVWVCWFQGMDKAPQIVKTCFESLKSNLTDREIIVITADNYSEYVDFPDYIIEKWKRGYITNTHMTDLLRLELLLNHGGTWIDSTVFCSAKRSEIPDYFFDSDLFLYQTLKPGCDGLAAFISSWFISACTNNKMLWLTRELCYDYWKVNNSLVDYFLFHDFLCMVLEHNKSEWNNIIPRDNAAPHIILLRIFEEYNEEIWKSAISQTPFHKLSYKFSKEQMKLENTFYKYLVLGNRSYE